MSVLSPGQKKRLAEAAQTYQGQLRGSAAEAYSEARGFPPAVQADYGLGYVGEPVTGHEQYAGRMCIPYITPTGIVQLKFRCIQQHSCKEVHGGTKYLGLSGAALHMFNTRAFMVDSEIIAITEGEIDAMASQALAGVPAVGFPGATSMEPYWHRAFTGYQRVLVLADGDDEGRKAAARIAKTIQQADVIRMPDGEDPNSLIIQPSGLEYFLELCGLEDR